MFARQAITRREFFEGGELVRARTELRLRRQGDKELQYYLNIVSKTPETAQVHGMYLIQIYDILRSKNVQVELTQSLHRFRYYSLRDFMELCLDASLTLYPHEPLKEALRKLGQLVIPTFFESSVLAKVLIGIAGNHWEAALGCVTRGYQVSLRPGKAIAKMVGPGRARVELRDIWSFGDSYQVGIIESLMDWYSVPGHVEATVLSPCDTDLIAEWPVS